MDEIEKCAIWVEEHESDILKEWKCVRCGSCCLRAGGGLSVEHEDTERWEGLIVESNIGTYFMLDLVDLDSFIHPKTNDYFYRCPFLRKVRTKNIYKCLINAPEIKPVICKDYPGGANTECTGIQRIIKQKLRLRFKSKEAEKTFFDKLDRELEKRYSDFNLKFRETNQSFFGKWDDIFAELDLELRRVSNSGGFKSEEEEQIHFRKSDDLYRRKKEEKQVLVKRMRRKSKN